MIALFSPFRSRNGGFLFAPSREVYRNRLHMCISLMLIVVGFISMYLCIHCRSRMLRYSSLSYSHWCYCCVCLLMVLVWLLLYSFHMNYIRSCCVTIIKTFLDLFLPEAKERAAPNSTYTNNILIIQ